MSPLKCNTNSSISDYFRSVFAVKGGEEKMAKDNNTKKNKKNDTNNNSNNQTQGMQNNKDQNNTNKQPNMKPQQ